MTPRSGRAVAKAAALATAPLVALALLVALLVAPPQRALAAAEEPAPPGDPARGPVALDPDELDPGTVARINFRFELDRIAFDLLGQSQVPGLVVVVAIGGEVVAAEAYGTADRTTGRELGLGDPLWIASLTKVLTAAVALDLVADGRISLDDAVTTHLPELATALQAGPGGPVTIAHLLGHAAGFEDRLLGMLRPDLAANPPLAARLEARLPPRSFEPGSRVQYCNVCYALLGMVIERASGEGVEAAFTRRLFTPLGLGSARLLQPADPAYEARTAPPHVRGADGIRPVAVPVLLEPTSGGARMSGSDVARLLATLTSADPGPPFDRGVREAMLARAFGSHPAVPGWTLGLSEALVLGHDALIHGGDLPGAHSLMVVIPRGAVALFVHVNGQTAPEARIATADGMHDLRWALAERTLELVLGDARVPPGAPPPLSAPADARTAAGPGGAAAAVLPVAGVYRLAGSARTGVEKLLGLGALIQGRMLVDDLRVELRPPALVSTPRTFVHEGGGVYRRVGGGEALVADRDRAGRPLVHTALGGPITFEAVPALERLPVVATMVGAFALLAVLVLVSWPLGAFRSWRMRSPKAYDASHEVIRMRWAARGAAASGMVALAAVAALLERAVRTLAAPDPTLLTIVWLGLAGAASFALWLALATVMAVASGRASRRIGLLHALMAAATLALLVQAWVWNLYPWA